MTKRSERSADLTIGLLLLLAGLLAGSVSAHEHTLPPYVKSLGAESSEPDAQSAPTDGCRLTLRLTDKSTGLPLSGLVRVTDADGTVLQLPELFNCGAGLP